MRKLVYSLLSVLLVTLLSACQTGENTGSNTSPEPARKTEASAPDPAETAWFSTEELKSSVRLAKDFPDYTYSYAEFQQQKEHGKLGGVEYKDVTMPKTGDYLFNTAANHQSWESLSFGEKAQLVGIESNDGLNGEGPVKSTNMSSFFSRVYRFWLENDKTLPDSVHQLTDAFEPGERRVRVHSFLNAGPLSFKWFLARYGQFFHFQTGKLLEINHENEPLPGGITLREVEHEELRITEIKRKQLGNNIEVDDEDWLVLYYRIYNADGEVIEEDLYSWHHGITTGFLAMVASGGAISPETSVPQNPANSSVLKSPDTDISNSGNTSDFEQ